MSEHQSVKPQLLNNELSQIPASYQMKYLPNPEISNPLSFLNPITVTQANLLQMQRSIGNQAVNRFMQSYISKVSDQDQTIMPAKPNRTGLPGKIKQGIEQVSGISLDNVRVRYNSDKPARIGAHAYTKGTDIYVAPGQEQYLPHEAWHVVQQAQGRVPANTQIQGVQVNDNTGMEREADAMGKMITEDRSHNTAHNRNQAAVQTLPIQTGITGCSIVQCKKIIRDGQIIDVPDTEHIPYTPFAGRGLRLDSDFQTVPQTSPSEAPSPSRFPGSGMRLGSSSHTVSGSMMVSRSVADSVAFNAAHNLPHFRPELGEVGHVSWVLSGRDPDTGEPPHTGIQHSSSSPAEAKDVQLPVQISIPDSGPQPVCFSNSQLLHRLDDSRSQLASDPAIQQDAMARIQQASRKAVDKQFEQGVPQNLQRQLADLKKHQSETEAIEALKRKRSEQIYQQKVARGFEPDSIPPAVVEKNMWSQLGDYTRTTPLGISHANLERGPLSRQAGGQFTLVAPHARHRLRLTPEGAAGLQQDMNQRAAARQAKDNALLHQLAIERMGRQHGASVSSGIHSSPHREASSAASSEIERQAAQNRLLYEMEMERRKRRKE